MLEPGNTVKGTADRYTLIAEHGRGGFGVTWKATRSSGEPVIVKMLHTDRLKDLKALELFDREARVLATLDHPAIPRYIDSFTVSVDGKPSAMALVQAFVPGDSLAGRMRRGERLSEPEMICWLAQILDVLAYLHHLSPPVIHRDVTPKNIILSPDGKAYLVDFGTVQAAIASESTISSTSAGTFGYAPMEQFVNRAFPSSDLYGLGMTYLAVATGIEPDRLPLDGVRVDVRRSLAADARVVLLLDAMTEPDPAHRLGDARVALERIRPLRGRDAAPALVEVVARETRDEAAPVIATDDLLPSERLAEAAARLGDMPAGTAWTVPLAAGPSDVLHAAVAADGSAAAVVLSDNVAILRPDLSLERVAGGYRAALTADGRRLATISYEGGKVQLLDLGGGKARPLSRFTVPELKSVYGIAISPDGAIVAVADYEAVRLIDAATGIGAQTLHCKFEERGGMGFSPDGTWLVACVEDDQICAWGRGGETQSFPGQGFAFSPDGRTLVVSHEGHIDVHEAAALLAGRRAVAWTVRLPAPRQVAQLLAFSPDGRHLALGSYDVAPHLVDVAARSAPRPLEAALQVPPAGGQGYPKVQTLGFSADSRRLLAVASLDLDRFGSRAEALFAFAVDSGRRLGALIGDGPRLRTPLGFHDDPPQEDRRHKGPPDPWWRPDVARAVFLGGRGEELLSAADRACLGDFEARWAFLESLRRRKILPSDEPLEPLLDATAGLTHLLPAVLEAALTAQSRGPRFGAAAAGQPLTNDLFVRAAREIGARPEAERRALFEQGLAAARAAEQAALAKAGEAAARPLDAVHLDAAQTAFNAGLAAEAKEDKKRLRRPDYAEALRLFEAAAAAGHPDAAKAAERIRAKAS